MSEFHNRQAVQLEDDTLRLSVTPEGGHIAELLLKKTGISPLWIPPWPTIEPSRYNGQQYPEYGQNSESKLLSGIMGHNLCLDIFGPPSEEEFRSGITVHGEGSVARYDIEVQPSQLTARVHLPLAQLDFQRQLRLHGGVVEITERVENNLALDRPIAWTQHVTLGEPFVERGVTRLDMPVEKSVTYPDDFGAAQLYKPNASFTWPEVPAKDGGTLDMTTYPAHAGSGALTGHLVVPERNIGFFKAWNPKLNTAVVYAWQRRDFPWICLWEENEGRTIHPGTSVQPPGE